ncbi:hypothetical protein [Caballeronia novacaledonica]|uniref:hypothetical protein n=1 Tax=Caballeronia novacaledonica TaxID=1544861 RepID=UPI0011B216D2|nr:hypothetical protein [Caballeronia novacaledonica]
MPTLLMPIFLAVSFVPFAAFCLKMSEWTIFVLVAAVVIGSIIVITSMLVAETSESTRRTNPPVMSMPLHHFARVPRPADRAPNENAGQREATQPNCSLCRCKDRRLRLGCLTCSAYCEDRK